MPYALLLFVAMPIIEIAVLLRVGGALGWFPTLVIVIITAFLGTAMLRQQGLATLNKARQRLSSGEMPAEELLEGMLLLVGGVLLLTPGFVTDSFGFACLIPVTRQWLARYLATRSFVSVAGVAGAGGASGGNQGQSRPVGAPVGSGSTLGAQQNANADKHATLDAGGRPQPQESTNASSDDVVDAEYRRVDD